MGAGIQRPFAKEQYIREELVELVVTYPAQRPSCSTSAWDLDQPTGYQPTGYAAYLCAEEVAWLN